MKRRLSGAGPDNQRLKVRVQGFDPGDRRGIDVLRLPALHHLYAFIEKIEVERTRQHGVVQHINFFCLEASWFNRLQDDLSDLPPLDTLAQVAGMCVIELAVAEATVGLIEHKINVPHIQADWWVKLQVSEVEVPNSVEVDVYLPAIGSANPATIGLTPNARVAWLEVIERVRPPSTLIKLQRFSNSDD